MLSLILFTRGKQSHSKAFMISQNLQVWQIACVRGLEPGSLHAAFQLTSARVQCTKCQKN